MLTWQKIYDLIEKKGPIRMVEIQKETGLTVGQVAGGLNTLRKKKLVVQSENKAYSVIDNPAKTFEKDINIILEKYKEFEKDGQFKAVYEGVKKVLENAKK